MISVFIITRNEEERIGSCIDDLSFCDEVLVVDAESSDGTVEIAEGRGARVIVRPWQGYSEQRNFAISECRGDWILYMDADERPGPGFGEDVVAVARGEHSLDAEAFYVNSLEYFMGDYLRHGGFGLDQANRKIRLWRAGAGHFEGDVHETLVTSGPTAILASHVLHHSSAATVGGHTAKMNRYSDLAAEQELRDSTVPSLPKLFYRPLRAFAARYFRHHGWRDGARGLIIALLFALYFFLIEAKLLERSLTKSD